MSNPLELPRLPLRKLDRLRVEDRKCRQAPRIVKDVVRVEVKMTTEAVASMIPFRYSNTKLPPLNRPRSLQNPRTLKHPQLRPLQKRRTLEQSFNVSPCYWTTASISTSLDSCLP